MRKVLLVLYIELILICKAFACGKILKVSDQHDFDNLQKNIETALKVGNLNINVFFEKGIYTYNDTHLNFRNLNYPDAEVSITTNGAIIQCACEEPQFADDPRAVYMDKRGNYPNLWSEVIQLTDTVEIVNRKLNICSIRNEFKLAPTEKPINKYIQVSCWFVSKICPIVSITKDSIFFNADDYCRYRSEASYNINMEYGYSKCMPRARVFGFEDYIGIVRKCKGANLLTINNCSLKRFTFSGFQIVGSNYTAPLFRIQNSKSLAIDITNNRIKNVGNTVLYDTKSKNVHFMYNYVDSFNGYGLKSDNGSEGLRVCNNILENCSLMWNNDFVICARSENFVISNNVIRNFKYGGIGVGCWHGYDVIEPCCGVVENNELYFIGDYLAKPSRYTLMDSGAIYTWTQTDGVTIRNNYIHDISGVKDNRGIFCDDGAKNVTITGNVFQRIQNSYCIDLRKVTNVAEKVPDHNTGNTCTDNLVDGDIRFYLRDETCHESNNKKFGDRGYKTMKAYKQWRRKIK